MAAELLSLDFQYFDHVSLVFGVEKTTGRSILIALEERIRLLLLQLTNRCGMNSVRGLNGNGVKHILFYAPCEDDISQQTQQE